jgi:predicted nucleic acid-binding protein
LTTYVDASVVLRIVLVEPGRLETWRDLTPISSDLIRVECLRTLDRARLAAGTSDDTVARRRAEVLELLQTFALAPITAPILERAADPFPTALGSLDALHLATALRLREELPDLDFATHDSELATAARSMGFTVLGA